MVDWDAIDTVLFDMDGTLLDLYYDNYFWHEYLPEKWGARHGLDPAAARAELLPRLEQRKGTLSWYCLDYWSAELGVTDPVAFYVNQLAWYDSLLRQDSYVIGATIFNVSGGNSWETFEASSIIPKLIEYAQGLQ